MLERAHHSNRSFAVLRHEEVFLALADPVLTGAGAVGDNCQLRQPAALTDPAARCSAGRSSIRASPNLQGEALSSDHRVL
jgi:hypothetical protein